jgi:hypothetical protein
VGKKRKKPDQFLNPDIEWDMADPRQRGLRILAALIAERHVNSRNGKRGTTASEDKSGGDTN